MRGRVVALIGMWEGTLVSRLEGGVVGQARRLPFQKMATRNDRPTIWIRSPNIHLLVCRSHHRTIIRQVVRWNTGIPACAPSVHIARFSGFQRSKTLLGTQTEGLCSRLTKYSPSCPPVAPSDNYPAN